MVAFFNQPVGGECCVDPCSRSGPCEPCPSPCDCTPTGELTMDFHLFDGFDDYYWVGLEWNSSDCWFKGTSTIGGVDLTFYYDTFTGWTGSSGWVSGPMEQDPPLLCGATLDGESFSPNLDPSIVLTLTAS